MKNERVSDKLSRREFMRNAALGTVVLGTAVAGAGSLGTHLLSNTKTATPQTGQAAIAFPVVAPAQSTIFGTTSPTILTADVVICGYGSCGIPAAIEAYDAGTTDIVIIEKADWLGGQGRRCGGGVASANSVVQAHLGVDDNFNDFYGYLLACGQGMVDPSLVRSFATNDNVDWIINTLGGQPLSEWNFSPTTLGGPPASPLPANTPDSQIPINQYRGLNYSNTPIFFQEFGFAPVMRSHWFNPYPPDVAPGGFSDQHAGMGAGSLAYAGGGTGVFQTLNNAIIARNSTGVGSITVLPSTTLTGLVTSSDGEVLGISAIGADGNPLYVEAKKGVVLGTGGWSGNIQMAQDYLLVPPSQYSATNPASARTEAEEDGVGVLVAQAVGADTVNMAAGGGVASKAGSALTPFTLKIDKPDTTCATLGAGGLRINTDGQVVDVFGDPIPRLYAGGRVAGGLVYMLYPVCGTGFGSAMWQGRVAGKSVAALTPWT